MAVYMMQMRARVRLWTRGPPDPVIRCGIIVVAVLTIGLILGLLLWPRPIPPIADRALPEGLRGRNPITIVAFGSSLTARNTWPDNLATQLETCFGTPVHMLRVARSGEGSAWALEALDMVISYAPDLILIEFAINDADALDGVSLQRSIAQHSRLLSELHERTPQALLLLMTMSPATGLRGLKRPRLRAYYAAYNSLSEVHDVGLADFYPRWLSHIEANPWSRDGLHPTNEASGKVILPVLRNMIGTAFGVVCP